MMRPRFSSGLVLGLAIGMPLGALVVFTALPPRGGLNEEQQQQLEALRGDVEAIREAGTAAGASAGAEMRDALDQLAQERARTKSQIDLFEELAGQVSSSLAKVESRLEALESQAREQPRQRYQPPAGNPYPRERRYDDRWE